MRPGDGSSSWYRSHPTSWQLWGGEKNGDVDARVLDKQRAIRKGGPGFLTELHKPQRCRNLFRRVEAGGLEALGSEAAFTWGVKGVKELAFEEEDSQRACVEGFGGRKAQQ